MTYDPYRNLVGGFSQNDGTVDFYLRVNSLIKDTDRVLDLGAGRAGWYEDDPCETRKKIRNLKGKVSKLIAADVDEAVLQNRASDEQLVIKDGIIDIENESLDLVVADYVLEHISDPEEFVAQISKALKKGGWFCARTPHKAAYVAIVAALVANTKHSKLLKRIQPEREEFDVFPTAYKMNTMKDIATHFAGWNNKSFIFRADPAYYFGNKYIYHIQDTLHRFMLKEMCGNLFIFVQKGIV